MSAAGCGSDSLVGAPLLGEDSIGGGDSGALDSSSDGGADQLAGSDVAVGTDAVEPGSDALVVGTDAVEPGTDAVLVGTDAVEPGSDALVVGTDTVEPGTDAVVVGTDANEPGSDAVEPGSDTTQTASDAVDPGTDTVQSGSDTVDPGTDTVQSGSDTVEPGSDAVDSGSDAIAPGSDAAVTGSDAEPGSDVGVPCDPTDCATPQSPCLVAACNPDGSCGTAPAADGTLCDDAEACTTGDQCVAGTCAGSSQSCDDGNLCTDDTCDPVSGACSTAPNAATCDDGNACTEGDVCGAGACAGTAAAACDDGNPCTTDSCDPASGCAFVPASGPACSDGNPCTLSDVCSSGACLGTTKVCNDANPCTEDACVGGNCDFASLPDGVVCDDGEPCTSDDLCGGGQCAGIEAGCNDGNPCTTDACQPGTGCVYTPNTATCDDGNACTSSDACAAGKCAGAKVTCSDDNPCTDDGCDPAVGCAYTANTSSCLLKDICEAGTCTLGQCVTTGVKSCDDGNPCTTDSCDTVAGCQYQVVANGSTCADGNACVSDSVCQSGTCVAGVAANCDDGKPCTDDACDPVDGCTWVPSNKSCDDGNACTIGDVCGVVAGQGPICKAGAPLDLSGCADGNPCTLDSCDPASGCIHPAGNDGQSCDDGSLCTSGDACAAGVCKGTGSGACDDSNVCTTDKCDAKTGACTYVAFNGVCSDGNPCTTTDSCAASKCVGVAKSCNDSDPCTADSCDTASGNCIHAPLSTGSCDDGNACTLSDACDAGVCKGSAKNCSDGNTCTDDGCDTATGNCVATNNTAPCQATDLCAGGSACAAGTCVAGSGQKCDDANPCTIDSCDASSGACSYVPVADGSACDDGIACTTSSVCGAGICTPTAPCTVLSADFPCGTQTDWTIVVPAPSGSGAQPRAVKWSVDQTPAVTDQAGKGCTLNFNDGTDYCDTIGGQNGTNCQRPEGSATSPTLDFTQTGSLLPTIRFDSYIHVEDVALRYLNWDTPKVVIKDATSGATLKTVLMPVRARDLDKWKNAYEIEVPEAIGKQVKVELSLNLPYNFNNDIDNKQKGWFVDNFQAIAALPKESACGDNADDDLDGTVDCADADCASSLFCAPGKQIVVSGPGNACDGSGWTFASNLQQVTDPQLNWAVDATSASVTPHSGACTLNFNDGTNLIPGVFGYEFAQPVAGTATRNDAVSLNGASKAALRVWVYLDVEPNGACQANSAGCDARDVTILEISRNNFAGCQCGANQSCPNAPICSSADTISVPIAKTLLKQWFPVVVDLSEFAGSSIRLRTRFDSVNDQFNSYSGVYLDDFEVIAAP